MQLSTARNIGLIGASTASGGLAISSLAAGGEVARRTSDDHPVAAGVAFAGGVAGLVGGIKLSNVVLSKAEPMLNASLGARALGVGVMLGGMAVGLLPAGLLLRSGE